MSGAVEQVPTSAVVSQALRKATVVQRGGISLRAGIVAAIPVAGMLALGFALSSPSAAVTMGTGAMLVGVAWRAGHAPFVPPIGTMTAAAGAIGVASFTGSLTGHSTWLHAAVLALLCLISGAATALGRRGTVPGTQALIAFIVFGRFPLSLGTALAATGLVLAGAACQIGLAGLVALPLAWRRQRAEVAGAYRRLEEMSASLLAPSVSVASALESAERLLEAPAVFADPELATLADLVALGRRIRLELAVLGTATAQLQRADPDAAAQLAPDVGDALAHVQRLLGLIAEVVDAAPGGLQELEEARAGVDDETLLAGIDARIESLAGEDRAGTRWALLSRIETRMAALAGQVTAAATLAAKAAHSGRSGWIYGRPSRGGRRAPRAVARDVAQIWDAASLHSPAGRHALRLAIVVVGTYLLVNRLGLPRPYWAVVAAATVLRPSFGETFTRGAERVLGTLGGVVVATLIAESIDPGGWAIVGVVAVLAVYTYAFFAASFAAGIAGVTAVIVFLLHAVSPDSAAIALDRGIDTAIGGAIGLAVYVLWPTWSATSAGWQLAGLVEAQREYLRAVLGGLASGRRPADAGLRPLARRARIAWTDAEAAVTLARAEPPRGGPDPNVATSTLGALRRVVYAVHSLRLECDALEHSRPLPALSRLGSALDESLGIIAGELREGDSDRRGRGDRSEGGGAPQRALPPLRARYREAMRQDDPGGSLRALQAPLDELVDATDTTADALGLELP